MKSVTRNSLLGVSLALLAIVNTASMASAQSAAKGKFTLPTEIQWGAWTMPAGTYTFMLDRSTSNGILTVESEDQNATFKVFHRTTIGHEMFGKGDLHLVRLNGRWQVAELHLPPVGQVLCYSHDELQTGSLQVARNRSNTKTIPVTVFGK